MGAPYQKRTKQKSTWQRSTMKSAIKTSASKEHRATSKKSVNRKEYKVWQVESKYSMKYSKSFRNKLLKAY